MGALLLIGTGAALARAEEPDLPVAEAIEKPPLVLAQGEQRLLTIPGLTRYSLGSAVVRIGRGPGRSSQALLVKGVQPGIGDLWVWKSDGPPEHRSIQVEKTAPEAVSPALSRALGALRETEVLLTGGTVILHGKVATMAEAARIAALAGAFPKEVHDETEVEPALLAQGARALDNWIRSSPYASRLRVDNVAGRLWVRGAIENPGERQRVLSRLQALFPLVETEIGTMPDTAPTVHIRVFLLELKKSRFHSLGLAWPAAASAFRVTTSGIQDVLSLDTTLEILEGEGSARILSSPELVVRAPGEAELFAGGEIPLEMKSHFYSNVVWKNYGLTLKLNVTHTTMERVRLDVFTEVSHLDSNITVDKIPGIQANRLKTQVDARYGVPLLLSGLLQHGIREEAKGLPFLRSIPILGALFGSDDYLNERSELVAILLPEASPPDAPTARFARLAPKGYSPIPRSWMSPEDEKRLRESPDYPWNALE